jgi:DNA-binding transcriptional regulator YdaS (Cro superfamily)
MSSALIRAIEVTGGPSRFLAALGISPRTLAEWRRIGVPDTRCLGVEAATGGAVTAEELSAERVAKLRAVS